MRYFNFLSDKELQKNKNIDRIVKMREKKLPDKPYVRKTSIEIPVSLYKRWEKLKIRYGVGHAATAGIILLDKITAEEREAVADEAKNLYLADKLAYKQQKDAKKAVGGFRARAKKVKVRPKTRHIHPSEAG